MIVEPLDKISQGIRRLVANRQALSAFLSQVVAAGASLLISVVVIRYLGLEEFGRFSVAALIIIIIRNLAEALIFSPMSSIGPKLNSFTTVSYRGFVLLNAIGFFFISSLIIWLVLWVVGKANNLPWLADISFVVGLACALSGLSDFFRRQQFIIGAPGRSFAMETLRYGLNLGLIGSILYFDPRLFTSKIAILIAAVAAFAPALWGYASYGKWVLSRKMNRAAWWRHWNFIRWMIPGVGLETVQSNFPSFYVAAALGEGGLGLVRAAQQVTAVLNLPVNALTQVIPAIAAARITKQGHLKTRKFLKIVGLSITGSSLILASIVLVASDELSSFMKIDQIGQFRVILALFLGVNIINAMRFSNLVFVNAVEMTKLNFIASLLGSAGSIISSLFLTSVIYEMAVPVSIIAVALINWISMHLLVRKMPIQGMSKEDGTIS